MTSPQVRSIPASLRFVWLNLWFWTVAPIFSLIFGIGAFAFLYLVHLIGANPRNTSRLVRRTLSHYGIIILKIPWPLVRVKFVDHAPGDTPPFVFVANHPSSADGFLMSYLPFEAIQVLNIWPYKVPIMGFIARAAGYLSVREMPFDEFLEKGSKLLAQGCSVVAFPEGTRSGAGPMGPFHGSAFRLAQHNSAKIVPLVLSGNERIPPRGSALLEPGHIVVTKLPAMTPQEYAGMSAFKLKSVVRERILQHQQSA